MKTGLTVNIFGLDDPGKDLTIIGVCDTCGATLWRRLYVEGELQRLGWESLMRKVRDDVAHDRDRFVEHHCVSN